ncbi:MAG: polysaccharide deacetylase family protein [Thermoleophilia bacterium]|nr:polysaccharide deacetylase family protein [Thermoleophilia bacterium]
MARGTPCSRGPAGGWSRRASRLAIILALALLLATTIGVVPILAAPATVVRQGPTDRPRIALTFDDNFNTARALATLGVLERYDVEATMFVIGNAVNAYPSITRAIADGGFEVADHTRSHPQLTRLSWSSLLGEIGGGTAAYRAATGRRTVPLFRPPYGATNSTVAAAAGAKGFLYVVNWDVDTNDWRGLSGGTIRDHVLRHAHNGAIVLMHLSAPHTAEALPGIITGLRARGYELVTVSELLKGERRFLDVAEATALGKAVLSMVGAGFMNGYDSNYFGPADPMTRAQFAKVAVLVAGLHTPEVDNAAAPTFVDVRLQHDRDGNPIAYPFDYIEEAAAAGILAGRNSDSGKVFDPARSITRGQLAQMLARMARELKGYPADWGAGKPAFPDVPDYAAGDVAFVAELGLMTEYSSLRFDPWSAAQRAHVAVVMTRFLDLPSYEVPPPTTTTTLPPTTTTTLPPTTTTTSLPLSTTTSTATTTTVGSSSTVPAG